MKEQWSRRELLQGGAGLALGLSLSGCGVGNQEEAPKAATERDEPAWQRWIDERFPMPQMGQATS